MIEPLEHRFLLTITITTTSSAIIIQGDSSDNILRIDPDIGGLDGDIIGPTSIGTSNGEPVIVNGEESGTGTGGNLLRYAPWIVDLGDGNDTIIVRDFATLPNATIKLGNGNDRFYFLPGSNIETYTANDGQLSIDAGAGDDYTQISTEALRNLSYFGGNGRDRLYLFNVPISGKLQIVDTQGPSIIYAQRSSVSKETAIVTGNSIDRITLDQCSFRRSILVSTNGGNDVINLTGSASRSTKDIFAGEGNNTVIP